MKTSSSITRLILPILVALAALVVSTTAHAQSLSGKQLAALHTYLNEDVTNYEEDLGLGLQGNQYLEGTLSSFESAESYISTQTNGFTSCTVAQLNAIRSTVQGWEYISAEYESLIPEDGLYFDGEGDGDEQVMTQIGFALASPASSRPTLTSTR